MPPRGPHVLAPLLAAIAAAWSANAQERTPEHRLVRAFNAYCVATAGEPVRVRAAIKSTAQLRLVGEDRWGNGAIFVTAEILDSIGRSDPHQRLLIFFGQALGDSGYKRTCQVTMPWGDKAKLIAELADQLTIVGGTSTVVKEGRFETDLTRWATRVGNAEAVVELGMPTYAGAPGRALTLTIDGQ